MSDQGDPFNMLQPRYTGRHRGGYRAGAVYLAGAVGFGFGLLTGILW